MTPYKCKRCGRETTKENLKGVRIIEPCPDCGDIMQYERQS